jgi:DNA (cytosine-5)-methyltransferase 1
VPTVGSLFSGCGLLDLGLERAGLRVLWQCEADRDARRVLRRHWPGVECHEDVRTLDPSRLAPVDLVAGGFPCQDLSVAGRRAGLAGKRSGLFREFLRVVAALRPRWVLLENVHGLLSSNRGRDMGAVLGGLGEFGFWWAYRVLDARHFGVAQRRRRVFIVGCARSRSGPAQVLFEPESRSGHPAPGGEEGEGLAPCVTAGAQRASGQRAGEQLTAFHVTQDPISGDVAPAMGAGNAQGCGTVGVAYNVVGMAQQGRNHAYSTDVSGCLQHKGLCPTGNEPGTVIAFHTTGGTRDLGAGDVSPPLRVGSGLGIPSCPSVAYNGGMVVRRLTPVECLRLMGAPDHFLDLDPPLSDSAKYRLTGNGVVVPVAEWIGRRLAAVALGHDPNERLED